VWVVKDHYTVQGSQFSVRSTDEEFADLVRGYLGDLRVPDADEAADDTIFQVDCGTTRVLPGGTVVRPTANLFIGSLRIFCGPRWEDMAGKLIAGVRDLVTARADEAVRFRAAGAVIGDRALILPSGPERHLPALSAALTRGGAGYIGDEIVKLDPILRRVSGLELPILLDVSDLDLFPEVNARARRVKVEEEGEVGKDSRTPRRAVPLEVLGGHRADPTDLGWIVFPDFRLGEETHLEPVAGAEAVFKLMEAMLNAHVWGDRALILARDLVETVPVKRLVIGSIPEAADVLLGLEEDAS
jgi:hypothetical protein